MKYGWLGKTKWNIIPENENEFVKTLKIRTNENGENVIHLEITELVLVHFNIVNNDYQQDSIVLYTFVPNKSFVILLNISPKNFIFFKDFNSEFSNIEVWFTD